MKRILLLSTLSLMLVGQGVWAQAPQTISYQGVLTESDGNAVADGDYALTLRLYDGPANGTLLWEETQQVAVLNGIFNVILGNEIPLTLPFDQPYFLGVTVGSDAELSPRIPLTSSAYSFHAQSIADSVVSTAKIQDGAVTQAKLAADVSLPPGAADADWTVSGNDMFSAVSGNVGVGATSPTEKLDVVGNIQASGTIKSGGSITLDGTRATISAADTLEFHVGGERALRIEPTAADKAPNMIGGSSGNHVTSGVLGATISGGGKTDLTNRVTDDYGTVGGGSNNQTGDGAGTSDDRPFATIGGGQGNKAEGAGATVGGGLNNTARASDTTIGGGLNNKADGPETTVGGGLNNTASGKDATIGGGNGNRAEGVLATVGGGFFNVASGTEATIPGGHFNVAAGAFSFAAGRSADANHSGTFVWADFSTNVNFASSAPNQFLIRAQGGVGIGTNNPKFQLDVVGNRIRLRNSTASGAKEIMMRTDGGAVDITARNADLFLSSNTGNTIIEEGNGNVGIGTSSPGFKLHVNGSAGKPGGGSWSTASDQRLKDVKGNFKRGLAAVVRLQPIVYTYKKDNPLNLPSEQEYIGLIAQEVEKVIPEAVEKDKGEYLHLNNDPIIWSMLNAIKELHHELAVKTEENMALKRELHHTTAALSALQAKMAQFESSLQKLEAWRANLINTDASGMSKISMK